MAAALTDFTEDLEAQLTCAICNEIFTEPRTLPCLHTFCFECIQTWNITCQKERKTPKCPTCRAAVNVEGGDISKLPSSFTYNSLLQLFDATKMKSSQQNQQQLPECVGCSKRVVLVGFCPQCEGMICGDCMKAHKALNILKTSHQVTLWSEFKNEVLNSYINTKSLCKEKFHDKCRLEYYCQTCSKCICQKCSATAHSTHDKVSIEEAAENATQLISNEKYRLNQLLVKYKKELELSDENMTRVQNEVDEAKAEVRNDASTLIKIVQDHEEALIVKLDEFLVRQKTTNEEEKNEINACIQQITQLKNQCESMEDKNLEQFTLEGYQNLQDVCKTTVDGKSVLTSKPVERNSSVKFISNVDTIQSRTPSLRSSRSAPRNLICRRVRPDRRWDAIQKIQDIQLGKVVESVTDPLECTIECISNARCGFTNQFGIVTRDSEGVVCYTNKGSIDVQIQDVDGNNVKNKLVTDQIGKFLVEYKSQKPSPCKVVVRIGGKEIKNSPQSINTSQVELKFTAKVTFGGKKLSEKTNSLAVSKTGLVAVDDDKRVVLFNAHKMFLLEIGNEGAEDAQGLQMDPWRVVFNEDRILVSGRQDGCGLIKEFGIDGAYKRTFYKLPREMGCAGMHTTKQSIACLTYNDNNETFIQVLDKKTGDFLGKIQLAVPNADSVGVPMSMTYHNKKYFVSFKFKDSVHVFDENGNLLYTFGEKGNKEGQFNAIRGLAVFGGDMLLVCDCHNHRVQVFTQDGQYLSSFGSYGSGLGQMKIPVDVLVTPVGRVLVLEKEAGRVHEWEAQIVR